MSRVKTFDEWSKEGYRILKGSKHVGRNEDGVPLFNRRQVRGPSDNYDYEDSGDVEYDVEMQNLYNYDGYFDDIGDR